MKRLKKYGNWEDGLKKKSQFGCSFVSSAIHIKMGGHHRKCGGGGIGCEKAEKIGRWGGRSKKEMKL
ncbi:hypothetical protein [uncultured Ruminococcus sp.]|uniref:hypothetical protein n=1 Tax=uncultured Ruminococcus sp. TaxID=165186 RepID=UPI0025F09838|nr:hypothetical protein [uncultured Ruminococcus sp.]